MSCEDIIGREKEKRRLAKCIGEKTAQLVIVYGRRRVGKTYLINEFFDQSFVFKLTGVYDQPDDVQLANFARELKRQTGMNVQAPENWFDAFESLRHYLEEFEGTDKKVVFFDEMPWLDAKGSDFLPAFEWFWNDYGCTDRRLVFIVCGSAASWMSDHIDNNKGGLFSRQTCRLYLMPFDLHETESYLRSKNIAWSRYDIAECYMIMGGIPYYLSILDPGMSYGENIDCMFFMKNSELWDEFDHLYRTLFKQSDNYIRIVEALSKKRSGLLRKEISDQTGLAYNGVLSGYLKNLEASGFIRIYSGFKKKKRDTVYQLTDQYTLFYFRFIRDNYGKDDHFWRHSYENPARRTWAGLTFEQLCWSHVSQIKRKLGISGVVSEQSVWYQLLSSDDDGKGAQIDMLIDRKDRTINICEIKFSTDTFEIDGRYEADLRRKIEAFRTATGTKKTLTLTMITTFGVKKGAHTGIVGSEVTLDDLFEESA